MKNFIYSSLTILLLFAPMNILSRLPYRDIWNRCDVGGRTALVVLVLCIWSFMIMVLTELKHTAEKND